MRDGQGRPTPKRATNLANTADILLWENLITQWHLFMETNRNTTQSHTANQPGDGSFSGEVFPRPPTMCWKPEGKTGDGRLSAPLEKHVSRCSRHQREEGS